jgi:small conductance mechanosensitive channel
MDVEQILDLVSKYALEYGLKLIGAIAVWIIGSRIIKFLVKSFTKMLERRNVDISLRPFLIGLVGMLFKVMLAISALSIMGIKMTSFIAVLGAAGLAIGMALSGTLQNFAGGVMILLFKPFKAGDFLEAQGHMGTVAEIGIFNTILKTPDNKTIILPNGSLSNSSMINYSTEEKRRVDWTFGIGYGDDTEKARAIIKRLGDADERILKDPELFIMVSALADSSVNFAVRAWVKSSDYWNVFFEMNEKIYNAFNKEGINIPFPQMDVHVHNNK